MSTGSVFLRKDGRWEGRISLGTDPNGKRLSRSFYGKTREEAESKLFSATSFLAPLKTTGMKINKLCAEWLMVMSSRVKISTLANYRMKIEKHIIPAFGELQVSQISCSLVQGFIEKKLQEGLSARYVTDILVLLKSILKYSNRIYNTACSLDGVIMPKCSKPQVRILTNDQQNTLKSYIFNNMVIPLTHHR